MNCDLLRNGLGDVDGRPQAGHAQVGRVRLDGNSALAAQAEK